MRLGNMIVSSIIVPTCPKEFRLIKIRLLPALVWASISPITSEVSISVSLVGGTKSAHLPDNNFGSVKILTSFQASDNSLWLCGQTLLPYIFWATVTMLPPVSMMALSKLFVRRKIFSDKSEPRLTPTNRIFCQIFSLVARQSQPLLLPASGAAPDRPRSIRVSESQAPLRYIRHDATRRVAARSARSRRQNHTATAL